MGVYKTKSATVDGRCWFFKCTYEVYGEEEPKLKVSKKYATKEEAATAESEFLEKMEKFKDVPVNMTFQELFDCFLEKKKTKVRFTTYQGYLNSYRHIKCFMNLKCVDYNINHYWQWKKNLNKNKALSTRYKNDILKFWKSILNYGTTWYNFNFMSVYRRMDNFTNPNELKKEMLFYTLDEFKKFISVEDDPRFICYFETLFYCGLRCGEARGLTWDHIDLEKKTLNISRQLLNMPKGDDKKYDFRPPKTKTSIRKIPICKKLASDLQEYKQWLIDNDHYKATNFVFGTEYGAIPFVPSTMRDRKKKNAINAGVKIIRTHDFRHSCASLLINSGGNVTMVAKYLGHSELEETLNTYSHLFPSALDNVLGIINNLNKKSDKL